MIWRQLERYSIVSSDDYFPCSFSGHRRCDLPHCRQNGESIEASRASRAENIHFSGVAIDPTRTQSLVPAKRTHAGLLAVPYLPFCVANLGCVLSGQTFLISGFLRALHLGE